MSSFEMHQFICRSDNYGLLVHDHRTGTTLSIDAPDASAIEQELRRRGWQLTHILTTHHHGDHVDGNLALKEQFGCRIIGPEAERGKIPGMDQGYAGGASFSLAGRTFHVFACPGHTLGHIAYHVPDEFSLFAGDTLFAMGCGRVLEGTMEQMYHSVNQFRNLQSYTYVYCGHEYTEANARFALAMEPSNRALHQRAANVAGLTAKGAMTCPTTIAEELATNPFMRCDSPAIRQTLGMSQASDAAVFAELRSRKNSF